MEHLQCNVLFTAFIPRNIQATPYILFTSHGHHNHPPPPPHKPPELILKGIQKIIQNKSDPTMTLGK